MQTSALNKFDFVAGELQNEYRNSWALLKEKPALNRLLGACQVMCFPATGIANICRRFGISPAELEGCIVTLLSENLKQSREAWGKQDLEQVTKPAPELLETIRRAVTPTRPRRKATAKPKAVKKAKTSKEGQANA